MKRHIPLALLVALFALDAIPSRAADNDELQGIWTLEFIELQGNRVKDLNGQKLKFLSDNADFAGLIDWTYTTDDSKKPNHIDLVANSDFPSQQGTSKGIYKIKDDVLTICHGGTYTQPIPGSENEESLGTDAATEDAIPKSNPRPTAFDSKFGELMVLKREK